MVREGEGGLEPPVVAVGGGEPLHEGDAILLAIAPAREGDGIARLVRHHRVARELADVLVDEGEPARRLPCDERAQRLDVLPLAPGRSRHALARPPRRRARRCRVALDEGEQGEARVRHREVRIRGESRRERFLGPRAVREETIHAVLKALRGLADVVVISSP